MQKQLCLKLREDLGAEDSVISIDETGFLKKGSHSAGVARQYSGTAGRVENCQIGVFLNYSTPKGHSLLDRELYLPKSWCHDATQLKKAGIGSKTQFKTKTELAKQMLSRCFLLDVKPEWVTADSVYGGTARLRFWLEEHNQAYVLGVACRQYITSNFYIK